MKFELLKAAAKRRAAVSSDPYWSSVTSLLNFDTNLSDAKGLVWTAEGNANVSGGALNLDGTGDAITTPSNSSVFSIGTNWTWEAKVHITNDTLYQILEDCRNVDGYAAWAIGLYKPSSSILLDLVGPSSFRLSSSSPVPLNQDVDLCVQFVAGSVRMWINGVRQTTIATASNWTASGQSRIGRTGPGAYFPTGKILARRITKDVARYGDVSSYTPPVEFPSQYVASPVTSSLLKFDSNLTDNAGLTWTAVGNPTVSNGELVLDGTGDYLTTPVSSGAFYFPGDFTVEAIITATTLNGFLPLIEARATAATQDYVFGFRNVAGVFRPDVSTSAGATSGTTTSLPINTKLHVAFVRSGSTISMYINGIKDATTVTRSTVLTPTGATIRLGALHDTNFYAVAKIDAFKVTKNAALYTGNFTPPSSLT